MTNEVASRTPDHRMSGPPGTGSVPGAGAGAGAGVESRQQAKSDPELDREALGAMGESALQRLLVVSKRRSAQSAVVARFLVALHDGRRFPFDLGELRSVHAEVFRDCAEVLKMDALTRLEIHELVTGGGRALERLAERWSMLDMDKLKTAARDAGVRLTGL